MDWQIVFSDVVGTEKYYSTMIAEGKAQPAGAGGVTLQGVFNSDHHAGVGEIIGLSMHSKRGQIYRAALEYMAYQLKQGLNVLQQVSQFKAESVICVGGGSKNQLWNQIRADVLGLPIDVVDVAESTVLGAAMFVFAGVGVYADENEAQQKMQASKHRIYPSKNHEIYTALFTSKVAKEQLC